MSTTTFPPFNGGPDEGGPAYGDRQHGGQQYQQNYQHQQHDNQPQSNGGGSQRPEWNDQRREGSWQNNQDGNNSGGGAGAWQNKPNASNAGGSAGGWQNKQGGNGGGWQNKQNGNGGGWQNKQGGGNFQKNRPVETDMTMYKPYVIVANQDMPSEIVARFQEIAMFLESKGYTARVDGMEGISDAIEKTVKKIEVHLPWRDFNGKQSKFYYNTDRAFAVAKQFHPAYDTLKKGIQAFLAKNARLVMGDKMISPALFLLCWTEDGCESLRGRTSRTGFAGHPIAIAAALPIPVFNLAKPDAQQRLTFLVESTNE